MEMLFPCVLEKSLKSDHAVCFLFEESLGIFALGALRVFLCKSKGP